MATEKKFLSLEGLEALVTNVKQEINDGDNATLEASKEYADNLSDNYDAAGTATTKVQELAEGQVKTNTEAIDAINDEESGILAQAKTYADSKDASIESAKDAADAAQADVDTLEPKVEALEGDMATVKGKIGTMDNLETTSKADLVSAINEVRNAVSAGGTNAAITIDTSTTTDGALKSYTIKQGTNVIGTIDIPKDMVVESGEVVTNPEGQAEGTYIKLVLANVTEPLFINVGTLVDIYKAKADATQVQLTIDSSTREISAVIVAGSIGSTELATDAVTTVKIADANVTKAKLSTEVQASLDKAGTNETEISNIKAKPAMNIKENDITAWNGEIGAKAIAEDAQNDVDDLESRVETLESVTYTEITVDEINALF